MRSPVTPGPMTSPEPSSPRTQVTVHRCVLRIRRTAGWSWGASSDALLDAASRALPALVAARLPELAAMAARPVDVTSPIRIRVDTTLAELAALAAGPRAAGASPGAIAPPALEQRVGAALEAALAAELERSPVEPAPPVAEASQHDAAPDAPEPGEATSSQRAALRVLRAWAARGAIERVLASFLPTAIVALHDLALAAADLPALAGSLAPRQDLAAPIGPAPCTPSSVASPPAALGHGTGVVTAAIDVLRARLALAAAILGADATVLPAQLRARVDASVPAPPREAILAAILPATSGPAVVSITAPPPLATAASPVPSIRSGASRSDHLVPRATEIEVRSALPFLILPALHHAGWLDAAAVLLDTHGLAADGAALAAALAGKLLDPPERGWMRTPGDRAIIAAFAGQDAPIANDQIAAAAVRLAPVLGVLDDSLRGVLAAARRPGAPIVLGRGAAGWSVLDSDGFAVLASAPALAAVLPLIAGLHDPLVVVPFACADPATLDRIDLANLRFVTDAPPTRGEPWRALAGEDRPLWTNDTATPARKLVAAVATFATLIELGDELTGELDARPAIARTPSPALETTATLAVTAALADLSARLFPGEPTTPILALTRFRDLDARVRFEPDCVRVRVPLGRRHADLMHHRQLITIPGVPWLGGRCVDLGGA